VERRRLLLQALPGWAGAIAWVRPGSCRRNALVFAAGALQGRRTIVAAMEYGFSQVVSAGGSRTRAPHRQRDQDAALAYEREGIGPGVSRTTQCGRAGLRTTQVSEANAARTVMAARAHVPTGGHVSGPKRPPRRGSTIPGLGCVPPKPPRPK